jgi:hypothetical protein
LFHVGLHVFTYSLLRNKNQSVAPSFLIYFFLFLLGSYYANIAGCTVHIMLLIILVIVYISASYVVTSRFPIIFRSFLQYFLGIHFPQFISFVYPLSVIISCSFKIVNANSFMSCPLYIFFHSNSPISFYHISIEMRICMLE